MKKLVLSVVLFASFSPFAHAQTISLSGEAATDFIQRHFPDADIPGPVKGTFKYINRHGQQKQGYAECFVPAMGGRSDGIEDSCTVQY